MKKSLVLVLLLAIGGAVAQDDKAPAKAEKPAKKSVKAAEKLLSLKKAVPKPHTAKDAIGLDFSQHTMKATTNAKFDDWCPITMRTAGVETCWDLAEQLFDDGEQHGLILNNDMNNLPCAQSNPHAEDVMVYPCYKQAAKSSAVSWNANTGSTTDWVNATYSDASSTERAQLKAQQAALAGLTKTSNGSPVLPKGVCSAQMSTYGVEGCWDLAEAVGLKGSQHGMMTNSRNNMVCSESNPQPSDVMTFICPNRLN